MSARSRTPSDADGLTRRTLLVAAAPLLVRRRPGPSAFGAEVPAAWFDLALDLVRTTPGFSPPVAARAFAYAGIALRRAVTPRGAAYHWPSAANGALARILRDLFPTTPEWNLDAIARLERRYAGSARAREHGARVARRVFEESRRDGGHEGFLHSSPPYRRPRGPGRWEPTPPFGYPALLPYWGRNRPFTRLGGDAPPPLPYSAGAGSAFYADAHECYLATTALTAEQKAIARFWADDAGISATPPGHSISITTQVVRSRGASLARAADAYAAVGIAVSDAFIACWRTKYRYNVLRPITYVQRVIDPGWTPMLVTPPFPEYTSGHSAQSMAAAAVLTGQFGTFPFTDRTHTARSGPPRSFASFEEAAREAAVSRMYGGIHFRVAIERGLAQGASVGRGVLASFPR
jgi:PAP2 superfamily